MLLLFKAKNYKSFRSGLEFSMIPAPKQTGLDYSVQQVKVGAVKYKALSSAVIYGPNAAGKTNIIGAMDTFRAIVLRGNIKNATEAMSPNAASSQLELIPCCTEEKAEPVEFSIKFIEKGLVFEYTLQMDIGVFLDRDYGRRITQETLSINETPIFARGETLTIYDMTPIASYLNESIERNAASASEIAQNGLDREELFLTNGFKSIFSKKISAMITEWFTFRFMVIYRADSVQVTRRFVDPKEKTVYVEKTVNEAARAFGLNSNALGYKASKDGTDTTLFSIFDKGVKSALVRAEDFESYGTIRFVNEFPLVISALLNGSTLVIDEFDASIHPMALMNIIAIFHNDDINIHHAQLIFNTHNPIFLDADLYRRDEIKFVERDDTTHESTHYSLSDFKTYGKHGVRKGEDYMRNYFINQYGAIKDIDFSSIMEAIIRAKGDVENG